MKTIIKLGIAAVIVIFIISLIINYINSQPDLIAFFDKAYESSEGLEDILENTFAGVKAVIECVGNEISSFFAK